MLIEQVAHLGLDEYVARQLSLKANEATVLVRKSFQLKLIVSLFIWLLLAFSINLVSSLDQLTKFTIIILASAVIGKAISPFEMIYRVQNKLDKLSQFKIVAFVASLLLKILFLLQNKNIYYFAFTYSIEHLILLIILLFSQKQLFLVQSENKQEFNGQHFLELLKKGLPLMLSGLSITIYMFIDQVMIKHLLGDEQVGIYALAVRIVSVWYFVPGILMSTAFAKIVRNSNAEESCIKLFKLITLLAIIFILITNLASYLLIPLFLGEAYEKSVSIIYIYSFSLLFTFWGVARHPWIMAKELQHYTLYFTIVGALLNIVLNLIMIPIWAGVGAALATLISYGFTDFISNLIFRPTRPIFYMTIKSLNPLNWLKNNI